MTTLAQEALIQKSGNSDYTLTDAGELQAYFYTLQNLLKLYMANKLKMDSGAIGNKLITLKTFAETHLKTIEDYLNKQNLIAQFIGEPDSQALSNYVGKQFLSSLEQVKHRLIEREIPIYRNRFENPFWVPSYNLLEKFEKNFINAAALIWPVQEEQENQKKDMFKAEPSAYDVRGIPQQEPQTRSVPDTKEIKRNEPQEQIEEHTAKEMSGEILLKQLEKEFIQAQPLGSIIKEMFTPKKQEEDLSGIVKQFSFLQFAQAFNQFSKFIQNKDTQGYNQWFVGLEAKQKALIKINQLFSKEAKGEEINWDRQIKAIASQHYLGEEQTKKMKQEISLYREVLTELHFILHKMPDSARKLYSQFVSLLNDEQAKPDAKKTSLKMTLLQIDNTAIKENLEREISHMIDRLQ